MEARTISQQVSDVKVALRVLQEKLKDAENNLVLVRVRRPLESRRVVACENVIRTTKEEVEEIKKRLEELDAEKVRAREQQKNIENLIHEQSKIVATMKAESAALLKVLKEASLINERILQFNAQYLSMEKQTGKKLDRTGTSGGFVSLRVLLEVCESECSGSGRRMFVFPAQFPV